MTKRKSYADEQWEEMQREPFSQSAFDGLGVQAVVVMLWLAFKLALWVGGCVLMYMVGRAVVG